MIQYTLKCADGHRFDSWFQSASAYDKLHAAGHVSCAVCGSSDVEKALMAPRVNPRGRRSEEQASGQGEENSAVEAQAPAAQSSEHSKSGQSGPETRPSTGPLTGAPQHPAEQALAEMRRHVEQNSDYVGKDFTSEARAMHVGDAPERAIWGEAKLEDAKALIDEGIPVAPLPFRPTRKTN